MDRKEIYLSCIVVGIVTCTVTRNHMVLKNRISLLENNLSNIKERLSDLELFKLKVYNNDISVGKRVWEDDYEEEVSLDLDLDE